MNTRNLSRRLERLEARLKPTSEPIVLVIQGVNIDRKVVSSFRLIVGGPATGEQAEVNRCLETDAVTGATNELGTRRQEAK